MNDLEYLHQILPSALIASLAGQRDPQTLASPLTPESQHRISFAARIARQIEAAESRETATAWLTSSNEMLGGDLPIKAIREGRFAAVQAAAERFVSGWAG